MHLHLIAGAAALVALAGTADAQFSAATSSSLWTSRPAKQNVTTTYAYHDGSTENALGLGAGGELAWFQGFTTIPPCDTITAIASSNGWTGAGGLGGAPAGSVGGVYVYDDPNGDDTAPTDITANDGSLKGSASWTVTFVDADVLEVTALPPSPVSKGFWAAASLPHPAGTFPAPLDTTTAAADLHSWVTGVELGAFDPQDPGADVGFLEMAALGFDGHWLLEAVSGTGGGMTVYCTAKQGLKCGIPAIAFNGVPSACASSGFEIRASPAVGMKIGLILYSCNGRANLPFSGGIMCVNPVPLRRTPIVSSGGTSGACNGVFSLDWNKFASGNMCCWPLPDPCLLQPGQQVNAQWWGGDAMQERFLSDALEFTM